MDTTQLVIISVSVTLTVLVAILTVQVFYILQEFRTSLQKVNKMLDDFGKMTGTVSESVVGMSGLVTGLRTGLSLFSSLRKKKRSSDE